MHAKSEDLMSSRIAHITSVHPWNDLRIFQKMCRSLANVGHDVHVVAAHGSTPEGEQVDGVTVHLSPKPRSRLERMTRTAWCLYRNARAIDADIYHFHDPELIPVGLLLRLGGSVVIYDVHEDMPKRIMDREWIPKFLRPTAGWLIDVIQKIAGAILSAVVTATPTIACRFNRKKTVIVRNYPSLDEFSNVTIDWSRKARTVVFVGTIDNSRGVVELIEGFRQLGSDSESKLVIAGRREGGEYDAAIDRAVDGLAVEMQDYLNREQIGRLLAEATVGAVTQLPSDFANEAISTKMFEYMAAGIPVVTTNMPLWTEVIAAADCGTTVDPFDCHQVAEALEHWLTNPEAAKQAGVNGRKAIEENYNWEHEFVALNDLYLRLVRD